MADRKVTVFEDEAALSKQLVQEVTQAAKAAISAKGSFSTVAKVKGLSKVWREFWSNFFHSCVLKSRQSYIDALILNMCVLMPIVMVFWYTFCLIFWVGFQMVFLASWLRLCGLAFLASKIRAFVVFGFSSSLLPAQSASLFLRAFLGRILRVPLPPPHLHREPLGGLRELWNADILAVCQPPVK